MAGPYKPVGVDSDSLFPPRVETRLAGTISGEVFPIAVGVPADTNPASVPVLRTVNDGLVARWEYIHNGNNGYLWHLLAGAQSAGGWMIGVGLDGGSGGFFIQRNKAAGVGIKLEQTTTVSATDAYAMLLEQRSQATVIYGEQFTEATAPLMHLVSYKNDDTKSLARWNGYTAGKQARIRSGDGALEAKVDIEVFDPNRLRVRSDSTVTNPEWTNLGPGIVELQNYAGSGSIYHYRRMRGAGSSWLFEVAPSGSAAPATWYSAMNLKYSASAAQIGFYGATPISRPAAIADATDAATAITQLNALLGAARGLGLIAP